MPIGTTVTSNLALKQAVANSGLCYGLPVNLLTAGGGTGSVSQAGATALRCGVNTVVVAPSPNTSCVLPSILSSETYSQFTIVINDAPNSIRVFCAPGDHINGSLNGSLTVAANGFGIFIMKPTDPSVGANPPGWTAAAFT